MKRTAMDVLATVGIIVLFAAAVVALIVLSPFGCADRARRGFLEHPEEAGVCLLKIKNETPFTAELRSGSLWWGLRDGLMPHTAGTLPVETGKRYVLTLRLDVNGVSWDETYKFYISRRMASYTIILGGLQAGVLYNMCAETVEVFPPNSAQSFMLPPGGKVSVSVMPGEQIFVIYFDRARQHWTESIAKINHIRSDQFFDGVPVDWIGYIVPSLRWDGTTYLPDNPVPAFR